MEDYLLNIQDHLRTVTEQYHQVITDKKLLLPIVEKLQSYAEERIEICRRETTVKRKSQKEQIDNRAQLYERQSEERHRLSKLDVERIKIRKEISDLSQEIEEIQMEMVRLQQEMAEADRGKKQWDTVFWATCWIPFANIGTGIKKGKEDGKYKARIKVCEEDCQYRRNRITVLITQLQRVEDRQKQNRESSGKLSNQITATEGQIFEVTKALNTLRREIALWNNIYTVCLEIEAALEYTNGSRERVQECFDQLTKVDALLLAPVTDKFIGGCIFKGNRLSAGEKLMQKEYLLSLDCRFALVMQADNDLVLYHTEEAIWNTRTGGAQGNGYVELDTAGFLSLKGTDQSWNARRTGAAVLILQDDGNLVTYDQDDKPLWASDTYVYANIAQNYFEKL